MRLSKKKFTALYHAINKPILDLRVENHAAPSLEIMDAKLAKLHKQILDSIVKDLNLTR